MKCKICGKRTNTLSAMRAHYVKNHPSNVSNTRNPRTAKRLLANRDFPDTRGQSVGWTATDLRTRQEIEERHDIYRKYGYTHDPFTGVRL